MFRQLLTATVLMILVVPASRAETYAEKIKDIDAEKKTITFPVDGKDATFKVDEKVDVQSQVRAGKRLRLTPVKDGLKGVKTGVEATITTEKRAGEEVVTKIILLVPDKK
jgi:hypothetical protein